MPKGPKGETRHADVIGNAVLVARIATGEVVDQQPSQASAKRTVSGRRGGESRAAKLTPEAAAE